MAIREELFFVTGAIGAHANSDAKGFRQRDLKFLIELFSNWVESASGEDVLRVQNTQLLRYLDSLTREGYARKIQKQSQPTYRLTRTGLLELLNRVVNRSYLGAKEEFLFLYYFLSTYRPRIEELVQNEGSQFPFALKAELDELLNERALVSKEIERAKFELRKLEARIRDAVKTSKCISDGTKSGRDEAEMIEEVERLYPYELNSQKPLRELMSSIPAKFRSWELTTGNTRRVEIIWRNSEVILKQYLKILEALKPAR